VAPESAVDAALSDPPFRLRQLLNFLDANASALEEGKHVDFEFDAASQAWRWTEEAELDSDELYETHLDQAFASQFEW
jgi:hypothetical protein